jgi:hypothetical protein
VFNVIILEDNVRRIEEMRRVVPGNMRVWFERSQDAMICRLGDLNNTIHAVSLDHDLEKYDSAESDPGDGRGVAKWIAESGLKFPVLIHTSNAVMGDSMYFTLVDSGFTVDRIDPYDDLAWIERSWLPKITKLAIDSRII